MREPKYLFTHQVSLCNVCCDFTTTIICVPNIVLSHTFRGYGCSWEMNERMSDWTNVWMKVKSMRKPKYSFIHQVSLCKVCCDGTAVISCVFNMSLSNTYCRKKSSWGKNEWVNKQLMLKACVSRHILPFIKFTVLSMMWFYNTNQWHPQYCFVRYIIPEESFMRNEWKNEWMNEREKHAWTEIFFHSWSSTVQTLHGFAKLISCAPNIVVPNTYCKKELSWSMIDWMDEWE